MKHQGCWARLRVAFTGHPAQQALRRSGARLRVALSGRSLQQALRRSGAVLLIGLTVNLRAQMSVGPWSPLFQGIDHAVGANPPEGSAPISTLQSVSRLRVDLSDPDLQFFTTPPASPNLAEQRETLSPSASNSLKICGLQIATGATFYDARGAGLLGGRWLRPAAGPPPRQLRLLVGRAGPSRNQPLCRDQSSRHNLLSPRGLVSPLSKPENQVTLQTH